MMNGNGQGQKLTNEERERLNRREVIAHDDPTALSTAAGRQAQREEDRRAGRVPPSEVDLDPVGGLAFSPSARDLRKVEWYVRREIQRLEQETST